MKKVVAITVGAALLIAGVVAVLMFTGDAEPAPVTVDDFLDVVDENPGIAEHALRRIEEGWEPGFTIMLLECEQLAAVPDFQNVVRRILERQTNDTVGTDFYRWYQWVWNKEYAPYEGYAEFKSRLYEKFDGRFPEYFEHADQATIRLDEIRFGGVMRDGIPPLDHPTMIPAEEADYLDGSNVVFGVYINGDARAYPKRILAWHEMFKDDVGGESVCGVYCTLCGSMILYSTEHAGIHYELGTSGFLYRSNKLMYDHETKSLWSTFSGEPVVGELVGKGIRLEPGHVVTTTWDQWRQRHPDTTVLSLDTGHKRDYREGAAYARYFATDDLMFSVPLRDKRMRNKDKVLAIRIDGTTEPPLAIAASFLDENRIYHDATRGQPFVVVTDDSGANRVYARADEQQFRRNADGELVDDADRLWRLSEDELTTDDGTKLPRLSAHRAFWFGWHAANPDTRLIQ